MRRGGDRQLCQNHINSISWAQAWQWYFWQWVGSRQSYLWALTVRIILRNYVLALSRMDMAWKACNLPFFTSVSVFPIIHWFSVDTKCCAVLHGYKQAQAVVGSIFFPWGLWTSSWGLSAVWDHARVPKGFLSLSFFSRKRRLRATPKD